MFITVILDEENTKLYEIIVNLVYTSNMDSHIKHEIVKLFKTLIFSKDIRAKRNALIRILKITNYSINKL